MGHRGDVEGVGEEKNEERGLTVGAPRAGGEKAVVGRVEVVKE